MVDGIGVAGGIGAAAGIGPDAAKSSSLVVRSWSSVAETVATCLRWRMGFFSGTSMAGWVSLASAGRCREPNHQHEARRASPGRDVRALLLRHSLRVFLPPPGARGDGRRARHGRTALALRDQLLRIARRGARLRRRGGAHEPAPLHPGGLPLRDRVPDRVRRAADPGCAVGGRSDRHRCADRALAGRGLLLLHLAHGDQPVHHQRLLGVHGGHLQRRPGQEDVRLHRDRGHAGRHMRKLVDHRHQQPHREPLPSGRPHADRSGILCAGDCRHAHPGADGGAVGRVRDGGTRRRCRCGRWVGG